MHQKRGSKRKHMANRKKEKPMVRVTVSLDPDDYKVFEHLAQQESLSTAWFIRRAMREFLENRSVPTNAALGGGV